MWVSGSKSKNSRETFDLGRSLGRVLKPGDVVCLHGELGAGKTTLVKGIAAQLTSCDPDEVTSPTFVTLQIYDERLFHFDLYRLPSVEAFLAQGFDEYLGGEGICCIEWPEIITPLLPAGAWHIKMEHTGDGRHIEIPDGLLRHDRRSA